ncbi:hypothetical protein JL722_11927 [Aureococcus anophagefferens]|nr:hypothetical protein JL722_11927 [Aureococcus anophagefferens]
MAKSGTWEEVVVRGKEAPLPFKGVSGAGIGGKAYFFGGYGGGYSDETHIVDASDPREPEWILLEVTSSTKPSRRAYHSTFAYKSSLWVFGGVGTKGYNNDVWRLQLKNDEGTEGHWLKVDAVGHVPRKRQGHTGTVVDTTFVVFIFGGFGGGGCVDDFVACLEIDPLAGTASWEPPKTAGVAPSARYGSSAVTFGTLLQPHKPVWRRDPHGHAFPGEPPSPRHCHGAAVVGNTIVFVGGSTKGPYCPRDMLPRLLNDVHCLRLAQKTDGNYVRSKVIIHSNQSKHRAPTRIFELKDINGL